MGCKARVTLKILPRNTCNNERSVPIDPYRIVKGGRKIVERSRKHIAPGWTISDFRHEIRRNAGARLGRQEL
jgi:hypothetical protein